MPVGTEIDVRLQNTLNSGTAQVEDRFEGTTLADVTVDGRVAIPAGSIFRGVVTAVEPGTRTNRTSKMTVSFDQVTVNGRSYPIRGTVTQAIEGEGIGVRPVERQPARVWARSSAASWVGSRARSPES